jgi:integrase
MRALYGEQSRIGGRFFAQWKDGNSFKHRWGELCRRADVHNLTFHDLRHTAASWLLEAGIDYAVIEKLLGHRLHGMQDGYIHNWEHRLREAVIRLETMIIDKIRQGEGKSVSDGQLWSVDGQFEKC